MRAPLLLLALAVTLGCGNSGNPTRPCDTVPPPASCATSCGNDDACASGFYCGTDGTCTADCSGTVPCTGGRVCDARGRCGSGVDQGGGGTDVGMVDFGPPRDLGDGSCARDVPATTVTPNVIFIIDQSGSMDEELDTSTVECDDTGNCFTDGFPELSRWVEFRDTLMSDGGIVDTLQDRVRFGVYLYTWADDGASDELPPGATCPLITAIPSTSGNGSLVNVALNNRNDINAVYSVTDTIEDTPTGESVDAITTLIENTELVTGADPTIFILATDGEPDTCDCPDHGENTCPPGNNGNANRARARAMSVTALERANGLGIETFVIGVADAADLSDSHMQELAIAGRLSDVPSPVPTPGVCSVSDVVNDEICYFRPEDTTTLETAINAIIDGQRSCRVVLDNALTSEQDGCDTGDVRLIVPGMPDVPLTCNDPNGFEMRSTTTLDLVGDACDQLLNTPGVTVDARFPCIIILG